MKILYLAIILHLHAIYSQDIKSNRAFSLFNVVKFKNSACTSTDSDGLTGVCYTSQECSDNGGTANGNCAASFGVCCIFSESTCGNAVTQNCSYIESTSYPSTYSGGTTCDYTITRCSSAICQVRLDFKTTTSLAQPTVAGCATDTLTITAEGTTTLTPNGIPVLCGTLTGQHVYFDVADASTIGKLAFAIPTTDSQKWRIKVSQIECSSTMRAPNGCLQYFTGVTNTITSFNYDGTSAFSTGGNIKNQDYISCFRAEEGMCMIDFAETQVTSGDAFTLNSAIATAGTGTNCAILGFVQITTDMHSITADTFCDGVLGAVEDQVEGGVIRSNSIPFKIRHKAYNTDQTAMVGFSLTATQVPCGNKMDQVAN